MDTEHGGLPRPARAPFDVVVSRCFGEHDSHRDRSVFLITSFRPDHVSSIAHTFTSTNPSGSAIARMTSSLMVVGTFADFFGHDTHTAVFGRISAMSFASCAAARSRSVANRCTMSVPAAVFTNLTPGGNGARSARYVGGAPMTKTVRPSVIPSFFASGVPE